MITGAILVYLGSQIDMRAALRAIVRISPLHLTAVLALVALDRVVMIVRWVRLLRASGAQIATPHAASIFLISSFIGSFLPAGVGGDVARAYGLSRATADTSEAVASVAVDRLLGVVSLLIMGIVGLLVWTPPAGNDWRLLAGVALLSAACLALFWADRLVRMVSPVSFERTAIGRRAMSIGDAVSRYRGRGATLLEVLAWSLVVQLLRITQAYLLGVGLGIGVPFRYYVLFMPVGLLMLLLPVSISGFGVPQGVIVWLLRPMGVPYEASFALATLIVLTGLAGNLPGLLLWLRRNRDHDLSP